MQAQQRLDKFEHGTLDYMLCFAFLAHAHGYKMFLHYGDGDAPETTQSVVPAFNTLNILERNCKSLVLDIETGLFAEQRLQFCKYNNWIKPHLKAPLQVHDGVSSISIDDQAANDRAILETVFNSFEKPDLFDTERALIWNLFHKCLNSRYVLVADPIVDWWQQDIDDHSIHVLKGIRIGSANWSRDIHFWRFELLVRQFIKAYNDQNRYSLVLPRILAYRGSLPSREITGSEFHRKITYWGINGHSTVKYRGWRVYQAAWALRRPWLDAVIDCPNLSTEEKTDIILRLDKICCCLTHRTEKLSEEFPNVDFPMIPQAERKEVPKSLAKA